MNTSEILAAMLVNNSPDIAAAVALVSSVDAAIDAMPAPVSRAHPSNDKARADEREEWAQVRRAEMRKPKSARDPKRIARADEAARVREGSRNE
jgi:hypothetical protein